MNQAVNDRLSKQFEELVPLEGKAESLAGEIVRAMSRIGYRFYNDGDQLGIGYGKETCNPAGRFLAAKTNEAIASMVWALWGVYRRDSYETLLDKLAEMVADYIDDHPELREQPRTSERAAPFPNMNVSALSNTSQTLRRKRARSALLPTLVYPVTRRMLYIPFPRRSATITI